MAQPNLLDYRKHGLDLRKTQAELVKAKPNAFQPTIEAIDEVMNANKTKQSNASALGGGIAAAAKAYFKGKDADKKIQAMEAIEGYAMAAQQQNDINEAKEEERLTIEPYATAAAEIAFSSIPYEQGFAAVREQYNQLRANYPNLGIEGDPIGYIPKSFIINVRDQDGTVKPFDLSQMLPEETKKRLEETALKQQAVNIQKMTSETNALYAEDQAAARRAYSQNIQNNWNPNAQFDKSYGQAQGKIEAKRILELEDQTLHLEDKKWQIKELSDMLKSGEVITGQNIGAWLSRVTGKQFNTKQMSETEAFDALSKNLLGFVKGDVKFGNMNQKEFEWLAKQTPESFMTKGGIERILSRLDVSIDKTIRRNEAEMKKQPNFNSANQQMPNEQMGGHMSGQTNQPAESMGVVKMITPEGEVVEVAEGDLKAALASGLKGIQ